MRGNLPMNINRNMPVQSARTGMLYTSWPRTLKQQQQPACTELCACMEHTSCCVQANVVKAKLLHARTERTHMHVADRAGTHSAHGRQMPIATWPHRAHSHAHCKPRRHTAKHVETIYPNTRARGARAHRLHTWLPCT